jgi:hypothetical protein
MRKKGEEKIVDDQEEPTEFGGHVTDIMDDDEDHMGDDLLDDELNEDDKEDEFGLEISHSMDPYEEYN